MARRRSGPCRRRGVALPLTVRAPQLLTVLVRVLAKSLAASPTSARDADDGEGEKAVAATTSASTAATALRDLASRLLGVVGARVQTLLLVAKRAVAPRTCVGASLSPT